MFLIYNFHLVQSKYDISIVKHLLTKMLKRDLDENDFNLIEIYGIEAFLLACLIRIDEKELKKSWQKINHIWTILNSNLKICFSENQNFYAKLGVKCLDEGQWIKVSSSLNHCLKFIKKENVIDPLFFELIKNICPLIFKYLNMKND